MAKSASGENNVNSTSVTTGTMSGQSGKLCIVAISTSDADSISTPSGWTLFDSGTDGNMRRYVFWRVLASTASVTFTGTSSGKKALTWDTWDATDIDTTNPISSETPNEIVSTSASTARTIPTATLTGQPRYALALVMSRGSAAPTSWTPPAGWTLEGEAYNTSAGATTMASASRTYSATGSQGGGSWTADSSESRGTTYLIILNPAAVPVTGSLAADTPTVIVGTPTVAWSGTSSPPVYAGAVAADVPTVAVGAPTVSWAGTSSPPGFTGTLTADAPTVTVGAPTMSWSGTSSPPLFTGDLDADLPTVAVGAPTVTWSGSSSGPAVAGSLVADAPTVSIAVPTVSWSGTVLGPPIGGALIADTPVVAIDVPTVSWAGTAAVPVYAGVIDAAAPVVEIAPPTVVWAGTFTPPEPAPPPPDDEPALVLTIPARTMVLEVPVHAMTVMVPSRTMEIR